VSYRECTNAVLPHEKLDLEKPTPLTWDRARNSDDSPTALVVCDRGHVLHLPVHSIAADGTVHPSIGCLTKMVTDREPCGWHVFARLEGWQP
jgi:hypothetical protein